MSSKWNQIATLLGPAGFSTRSGSGRPTATLGNIGDIYVDTLNAVLYASKTSEGWPSSGRTLVGPVTQTQLPNDITANSLALAAVSGDAHGVGMSIANSTGTVFSVDGSGNLTAQSSTVASLASTGIVSGSTFVSAVGALNNPAFSFNTQIDTGIYLPTTSTTSAVMALVVNSTTALTLSKDGVSIPGTLSVPGSINVGTLNATNVNNTGSGSAAGYLSSLAGTASAPSFSYTAQTDTGLYLDAVSGTAAVLALAVNGVQALALSKGGVTVPGTLSAQGASTFAGVTLSTLSASGAGTFSGLLKAPSVTLTGMGGQITFPDGTTQSTAASTPNVGVAPTFSATSVGSVTAPSFLFSAQTDSGLYLATTSATAAVLGFTVNKTQSLAMSAAGVSVPGTLTVNGASSFAGSATFGAVNMSNLTLTGNLSVGGSSTLQALTVTSLTNSGTTVSQGHTVSANGSASLPSYSFTAQPDTGMYLPTASATAAVLGFSANGTLALNILKGGITVPGTLGVSGASTLAAVSASSLAVSGNETIGGTSIITGLLTASGNITTPLLTTTQTPTTKTVSSVAYNVSNISLPGTFGDGSAYPPSGISSDALGNLSLNYLGIPFIKSSNGGFVSAAANTPGSAFTTSFLSGNYAFAANGNTILSLSATSAKYGFTANTVPFTMQSLSGNVLVLQNGGSAPNFTTQTIGTVDVSGNAVFAGTMRATTYTFGDGTTQTTAYSSTSASNQPKWTATTTGTTAAPAFTFTANTDTGMYLSSTSATSAVLALSVNSTDALTLSKTGINVPGKLSVTGTANANVFGALALGSVGAPVLFSTQAATTGIYFSATPAMVVTANGTAVASFSAASLNVAQTLNAQSTLAVTGTSTFAAAVGVTGALTATNLTIASGGGGRLTFADGTSQTTAGGAPGSSPTFSATSFGTATAPVFTFSGQSDTGVWLKASGTAATWGVTVNGTEAFNLTKSVASFNSLSTGGTLSSQSTITASSTVTGSRLIASTGTGGNNTAVQIGSSDARTGLYFDTATPYIGLSAGGVKVLDAGTGSVTMPLPMTFPSTVTSTTPAGTPSFVSSQGFRHEIALGHVALNSVVAGQTNQCNFVTGAPNSSTVLVRAFSTSVARSGSIVAIIVDVPSTFGSAQTIQINKNGNTISQCVVTMSANTAVVVTNFAKGRFPLVAGDNLYANITYASAVSSSNLNLCTYVKLNVEMDA